MTRVYEIVAFTLLIFLPVLCSSQAKKVFFQASTAPEGSQCYTIILNSRTTPGDELLSSQNFRLYYDASVLRFDRVRAKSLLPITGYTDLKVMQAVHNSNAQGFGGLEFAANLGYVNLSLNDRMDIASLLPIPNNTNMELASICFEVMDPSSEPALVWARDPLTSGYSSAYTEIAHYKNGVFSVLKNIDFQDIDANWTSHPEKMVFLGNTGNKR